MATPLSEALSFKRLFQKNILNALLNAFNQGYLILDNQLQVIEVNFDYQQFHNCFNDVLIKKGEFLNATSFNNFSGNFFQTLNAVLSGEIETTKLQLSNSHLFKNTPLFFDVNCVNLNGDEQYGGGVCVLVQKKETASPMSINNEGEDFYKLLVESSPGSVYQLADAGLIIIYSSNSVNDVLGYLPKEMVGKKVLDMVHPDDKEHVRDWFIALRTKSDNLFTLEYRIKNKQGNWIWIENNARNMLNNGAIKAIVMNFRNIQAKKIADDTLVHAEQRLSLLLNNTEESFIILNSRLRIVTYNKAAQEHSPFFFNQELQSGLSVLDLINKDEADSYMGLFEQVFQGNEVVRETKTVDGNKELHIFHHTYRPLFDQDKDIFGVFITSRDVTEKRKIEREQEALTEELLKNNQDLQQFSYITSHNLRAPVANLLSLLNLYNKQNPADDFNFVLIDKFQEATEQLNQTLNDLINVLVIKSNTNVRFEQVSFADVYRDVLKNIENLLTEKNGIIETDFSCVSSIKYSRIHMESIFLNMLTNAIRYSSPERSPQIKIRSYQKDSWVVVDFADNGLGMDIERYGDRLFGLYQRFHENKEGKGLGLYMTRSQIVAMGGKIEVESQPGVGTTFKVYFKTEE